MDAGSVYVCEQYECFDVTPPKSAFSARGDEGCALATALDSVPQIFVCALNLIEGDFGDFGDFGKFERRSSLW